MHKLIMVAAIMLISVSPIAKADGAFLCLKNIDINITSLDPGIAIHATDDYKRKKKMTLRMNVNCKTNEILVPSSLTQAKDWLDLALPYDVKTALTAGDDVDLYKHTSYGYSAEYDLYNYFNVAWKLGPGSTVCKSLPNKPYEKKGINWCFYNLLDSIREDYKDPEGIIDK